MEHVADKRYPGSEQFHHQNVDFLQSALLLGHKVYGGSYLPDSSVDTLYLRGHNNQRLDRVLANLADVLADDLAAQGLLQRQWASSYFAHSLVRLLYRRERLALPGYPLSADHLQLAKASVDQRVLLHEYHHAYLAWPALRHSFVQHLWATEISELESHPADCWVG